MSENQKKGNSVLLTVIAVATLLVAVVGATFAYFTASISGNDTASSVIVNTASVASITYENGQELKMENAYPGQYSNEITFTVSTTGKSDVALPYSIGWATATNTFVEQGDLVYRITSDDTSNGATETTSDATNSDGWTTAPATISSPLKIVDASFAASDSAQTHTYKMQMHFKETATNQNSNQGATFAGKIEVKIGDEDTMYFTSSNPTGTTTQPTSSY